MALEIRDAARNSIGSCMPAKSLELQHTIRLIRELDNEIAEIEEQIQSIMDELHSPITTIPGLGFRMAAMILAKWVTSPALIPRTSCWPMLGCRHPTYQSGQLKNCYPHMENAAPDTYAMPFTTQPSMSVTGIRPFADYLAKKRAEGKHYNVALSHAAKS